MWETRLGRTRASVLQCATQRHLHGCTEGGVDFAVSIVMHVASCRRSVFFKKKKPWRTSGIPAAKCREAGLFSPGCGHDGKTPCASPARPESRRWSKADFTSVLEGPPPPFGRPDAWGPKKNGNAIVPPHDHQQNSGALTDELRGANELSRSKA